MVEEAINNGKEKTSHPPFRVTQMDEGWAFEYGKDIRQVFDEWKAKGYTFNSPEKLRPYFEGKTTEDDFKTKLHQWYSSWDTSTQVKQLMGCEEIFNNGIKRYLPLQTWGFDIPDTYNVVVTPFAIGGGGAGQRLKDHGPVITMYYDRDYTKGRTREETLLHEAYHLGADETIQKILGQVITDKTEYQMTKERIVDICSNEILVPDVLLLTRFQHKKHLIDPFLNMKNLPVPERLQNYAINLKK